MKLYFLALFFLLIINSYQVNLKKAQPVNLQKVGLTPKGIVKSKCPPNDDNQSTVNMKFLDIDGTVKDRIVPKVDIDNANKITQCLKSDSPIYQICRNISNCDECSYIDFCGWCNESQTCVPGNNDGAACPDDCFSSWIFSIGCQDIYKSGSLDNLAPDATQLIIPEYATKKVKIDSYRTIEAGNPIEIIVGQRSVDQTTKTINEYGDTDTKFESKLMPIIGEYVKNVPISKEKVDTRYIDLKTGLDIELNPPQDIQYHGFSNLPKNTDDDNLDLKRQQQEELDIE